MTATATSRQRGKAVSGAPASARWAAVARDQASGELDLARLTIFKTVRRKARLARDLPAEKVREVFNA